MSDLDKLTGFLKDLHLLDGMQSRYEPDSKCGKAVAACLKAFQEHADLLAPFFGRAVPKPDKKGPK